MNALRRRWPQRMRATYHHHQGTEQVLAFYDVHADRLRGSFRRRKRIVEVSEAFRRLGGVLPAQASLCHHG